VTSGTELRTCALQHVDERAGAAGDVLADCSMPNRGNTRALACLQEKVEAVVGADA
jgi:hypothetical protein